MKLESILNRTKVSEQMKKIQKIMNAAEKGWIPLKGL